MKAWVECEVSQGVGIHVVGGYSDAEVREMLLRVVTAMQACGYHIPGKKIIIRVTRETGVDRRKHGRIGSWFDLPVALAVLIESGQIRASKKELNEIAVVGELALDGKVRPSDGGFLHHADTARAVSWQYRNDFSIWGWDCNGRGGDTWLDVKDLADAVELLEPSDDEKDGGAEL